MVKAVIELLDVHEDQAYLQHLLRTYDVPSSLQLCKLYQEEGDLDHVQSLLDRIMIIDPSNQEAQQYRIKAKSTEEDSVGEIQ
jgi:hypothetical protein